MSRGLLKGCCDSLRHWNLFYDDKFSKHIAFLFTLFQSLMLLIQSRIVKMTRSVAETNPIIKIFNINVHSLLDLSMWIWDFLHSGSNVCVLCCFVYERQFTLIRSKVLFNLLTGIRWWSAINAFRQKGIWTCCAQPVFEKIRKSHLSINCFFFFFGGGGGHVHFSVFA